MQETIIKNSKKKQVKFLIFGLFLTIACFGATFYIAFIAAKLKISYLIMFAGLGCVVAYFLIKSITSLSVNAAQGLVLNNTGIKFNNTDVAKKVGLVNWRNVLTINEGITHGVPFLSLSLKNPEAHISKVKDAYKNNIRQRGLVLTASELEINFDEMRQLVLEYFNRYN